MHFHSHIVFLCMNIPQLIYPFYYLFTETVQQIHTFQFFKNSALVNVSVTQYLQHTDLDLNKRPLPGYTMTHIIKDCLPYQLWVLLFIFILSDQLWPAIKPYSFQPNSLANSLSQEHTPSATSQRTDTLKRQALKQSEARKEQVHEGRGCLTFLQWEGPKEGNELGSDSVIVNSSRAAETRTAHCRIPACTWTIMHRFQTGLRRAQLLTAEKRGRLSPMPAPQL